MGRIGYNEDMERSDFVIIVMLKVFGIVAYGGTDIINELYQPTIR